MTFFSMEFD
uniref:Uncharacterized protein n=1 Tax=Rhizophora mucronata TaxID=61149 RepID=A0A2P2PCR5_RHIMU